MDEKENNGKSNGCPYLNEKQIEEIAEHAADKAIKKMTNSIYQNVGKTVIEKAIYIVGIVTVAALIYLQSKGYFISDK